ncbi:MAG: hypothetical protein O3A51_01520 [Verrucomicrobia bacterium]|nr:hypothetical protein [Verrucomicrobiota bacterium]
MKTPRILFIGNSQFFTWDIPGMVQRMAPDEHPLPCDQSLIGGAWLQTHLDSEVTHAKLKAGGWDWAVLQEYYAAPEIPDASIKLRNAVAAFCDAISSIDARPLLYASPNIEANGDDGFRALHTLNLTVARELNIGLAAAGLACLEARKQMPGLDLHHPDRAHPSFNASYIGACTLFAALTGQSPVGLAADGETMADSEARLFQDAAWRAHRETREALSS